MKKKIREDYYQKLKSVEVDPYVLKIYITNLWYR